MNIQSRIIECKTIIDVLSYADQETLVLFDVDNTLIEPVSTLGSVAWFNFMMRRYIGRGLDERAAAAKVYPIWMQLQQLIKIKAVEASTALVIDQLHARNIKTMGLTARGFGLSDRTIEQLAQVNVVLNRNTIYQKDEILSPISGFSKGIVFVDPEGDKGFWLNAFLRLISYVPRKVVFLDDMKKYLESVQAVLVPQNIPYIGLRYGAADDRTMHFEPASAVTELQQVFVGTAHEHLLESL